MSTTEGKGQQEEAIEIRKSIVIDASPEVVFKAITDPNELTNWFPDNAIFDGRVGGKVRFTFNKERSKELDRDYSPEGTVKEFIPNKKVSYTWQHKDTPEFPETSVTWELEEIDANKTRVELVHSGFTGKLVILILWQHRNQDGRMLLARVRPITNANNYFLLRQSIPYDIYVYAIMTFIKCS